MDPPTPPGEGSDGSMEAYEKNIAEQIMQLFAPLKRRTKDRLIDDLQKMRDRDETIGCLPTVYLTGVAPEITAELRSLRAENKGLRSQLEANGLVPESGETAQSVTFHHSLGRPPRHCAKRSKLKKISSFHKLAEIKTPNLGAQKGSMKNVPELEEDMKEEVRSVGPGPNVPGQTVEIEIVKHLQQGTGLLKKMRWSGPKIRVFKLSKDMEYIERESINLISFEATKIHLSHITAMENRTESTTDPKLAEAGFCIFFDPTGNRQKNRWFDLIAPTGADYILWTKGLQMVVETRAKSQHKGNRLKAELLELTLQIPITMINHWYVQHFPNGCMDDGDDQL